MQTDARPRLTAPGIILGIGLGGFLDGILLHQLLQWHHMLTSTSYSADTVHGLRINTLWDGLFHTFTWLAVLGGLALLYSRVGRDRSGLLSSRSLWGWVLVGWGLFNLVEGVVDHHVLGIHHVRGGPHQLAWDLGFLAFGALLTGGGWLLQRGAAELREGAEPYDAADR
ncbi:DUF2243 domain-containing protein [Couchioplanes caeruleus]|uniref:DUF2243 domain-containing protein n=2 Tax=Couchioplanes caeruleus TaxID=56438 RepID=A0A1K0FBR5_9ACTN|nr:DUF2243 domain-containing protein [Couchioplanes caeruleus]OJF10184.1 hypothetical protein BG844_33405 [Couchioplanes caeruleus subsp. caeruleus]ROP28815.1 putative membrane protein [Couchioplanes caeruleus]